MADVRALLKAKREEQRIVHPLAAYNQSGVLRCTVCDTIVKHASAWNGHLGSKSHRTSMARVKEARLREEEKTQGKRKVDDDEDVANESSKKRRIDEEDVEQLPPAPPVSASTIPTDFFSDPSRSAAIDEADSDEEPENDIAPPTRTTSQVQSTLDLEWAKFQEAVINTPVVTDSRETFDRATIFAEPQLSTEIPEGFPSSLAPQVETEPPALPLPKDEEAERRRRVEEEKELILDRWLDEERAQEEADERVTILKAKVDSLKQRRIAKRAAKAKI